MRRFERPFGMRHHAKHIARIVQDTGNRARRSVDFVSVAEGDAALAFEPIERVPVGLIIAVVMRYRDYDFLASGVGTGED